MQITEVRVRLVEEAKNKLKAFCSITIEDSFVVRDLKVIAGARGLFVAMPSRRLTIRCGKCGGKNPVRSHFCCECGYAIPEAKSGGGSLPRLRDGRPRLHADIAHPINSRCREEIQALVLDRYNREVSLADQPGYEPPSFEDLDSLGAVDEEDFLPAPAHTEPRAAVRTDPRTEPGTDPRKPPTVRPPQRDDAPEDNFGAGLF